MIAVQRGYDSKEKDLGGCEDRTVYKYRDCGKR